MNVHDSERLAGLLEGAGYVAAADGDEADVVVLNTCAVRENADNRLYGNLGHLRPVKDARPGMQIAVGGCLAQKDRGEIVRRAPWVDVVFGTHNVGSLPALLERARHNAEAQIEIKEALEVFPSSLPATPPTPAGCRSASAATTPARSASSRPCGGASRTVGRGRSSPRSRRWSTRACWR
jgi:tRNA-2-methylthio-N6-dimethylallyladenosine synthase